jgi:hypothetical protein
VSTTGQKGATGAAGNVTGAPTDPFSFIQGLLTPTDPEAARQLIDQVYAPIRQQIMGQIAQSQANALARAQQMQQVYGSFAQYMGGLQGNLASIYQQGHQDASAMTAGMAGPSGGVGGLLGQMQGFQNQKVGAEQQAYSQLGASMPGIYSLQATQEVKNMLNAETATEAQLRSKLLDLSSQEASQVLSYLQSAQDKDVQLKEWAYGQRQTQLTQAQQLKQQGLSNMSGYVNQLEKNAQSIYDQAIFGNATPAQASAAYTRSWQQGLAAMQGSGLITAQQARQMRGLLAGGTGTLSSSATSSIVKAGQIDVARSKLLGYLVDSNGRPIGGKPIMLPKPAAKITPLPEYYSRNAHYLVGMQNGKEVFIPGPDGKPQPYKAKPTAPGAKSTGTWVYDPLASRSQGFEVLRNTKTNATKFASGPGGDKIKYTAPGGGTGPKGTGMSVKVAQTTLDTAQSMIANKVRTMKKPKAGGSVGYTQYTYIDPNTGKAVSYGTRKAAEAAAAKVGLKPGAVRTTHISQPSKTSRFTTVEGKKYLWQQIYKTYSYRLFRAYRALYPLKAQQSGEIQKLVEKLITYEVGWGPQGV